MLLLLTGSSCSGKSTLARACTDLPGLVVHDADEHGVPSDADTAWRQRDLESWTAYAGTLTAAGSDLLLTAQAPWGELLATPSAPAAGGLAACLVDVADAERLRRLGLRDGDRWSGGELRAFVGWAHWHRDHAADPTARPEVVTENGWAPMRWDRWRGWSAGDPRWRTDLVDTTGRGVEASARDVRSWVVRVRAERPDPLDTCG